MRMAMYVLITLCAVLMLIGYALLVIASEEEERSERMYRAWKESKDGRFDKEEKP